MNSMYEAFAIALFHFVWQGVAIATLLSVVLFALRRSSPNSRYLAACGALALMAILPFVTMAVVYQSFEDSAPLTGSTPVAIGSPVVEAQQSIDVSLAQSIQAWPATLAVVREWAVPAWLLGVLLFSLRMLWAYGHVLDLRRRAMAADAATFDVAFRLSRRLGIARPFRVLISALADGPSVIGWLRPVIVLPAATLLGLTPQQFEAVLAHELAHIRRCDYLVNLLQAVVEILLFYHPAVWWVSNSIRQERELCCDDVAVGISGDAVGYARALTVLERQRVAGHQARPAMAVAGGWLALRVRRLVGLVHDPAKPTIASGMLALCLAIGILVVSANSADSIAQEENAAAGAESPAPSTAPATEESTPGVDELVRSLDLVLDVVEAEAVGPQDGFASPPARAVSVGPGAERYYVRLAQEFVSTSLVGPVWADVDRVLAAARTIGLSAERQSDVAGVLDKYRSELTSGTERVSAQEAAFEQLLTAESVDRRAISADLEALIEGRGELERTTTDMALEVRERLSRDEWIRLHGEVERMSYLSLRTPAGTQGRGTRGAGGRGGGPPPASDAETPAGATPTEQ